MHTEIIAQGTEKNILVHPQQIFKPAVVHMAAAIILIHNHPSGNVEPSPADIRLTKRLIKIGKMIGIPIVDYLIIADKYFKSISVDY